MNHNYIHTHTHVDDDGKKCDQWFEELRHEMKEQSSR